MLFYDFNLLDVFIKSNFINNLRVEKENIRKIITLYQNKKFYLSEITTNMIEITDSMDKDNLKNFYETISLLKNSLENVNNIEILASNLEKNLKETNLLYDKNAEDNENEIKANLVEYNKQRDELSDKILEFENVNTTILKSIIESSWNISNKKIEKQNILSSLKKELKINIDLEPHDNNTLIISEKEQKAYLPYFYSEIEYIYQTSNNQYQTLQDVINKLYIVPLNRFKNSAISRFKESFHLIRDKEKGSITKALDLGLELMFKYELNPIIIAACRTLDELDIYLDCLEENELYDFTCFKINFEVMPRLIKNKKEKKDTFSF